VGVFTELFFKGGGGAELPRLLFKYEVGGGGVPFVLETLLVVLTLFGKIGSLKPFLSIFSKGNFLTVPVVGEVGGGLGEELRGELGAELGVELEEEPGEVGIIGNILFYLH